MTSQGCNNFQLFQLGKLLHACDMLSSNIGNYLVKRQCERDNNNKTFPKTFTRFECQGTNKRHSASHESKCDCSILRVFRKLLETQ